MDVLHRDLAHIYIDGALWGGSRSSRSGAMLLGWLAACSPSPLLPAPNAGGFFCPQTPKETTRECCRCALLLLGPTQPLWLWLDAALHQRPTTTGAHSPSRVQHPLPHRGFRQKHLPDESSSPFQMDLSQKVPFPVEAMPRQQHFSQLQQGSCLRPTPSCPPMAHAQLGAKEQPHCHCPWKRAGPASPRAGCTQFPFCLFAMDKLEEGDRPPM